jgi:hypothetical protein
MQDARAIANRKSTGFKALSAFTGILVALCACLLLWFVWFQRQVATPTQMAEVLVGRSPEMERSIGKPIRRGYLTSGRMISSKGNGTADISTSISGPLGSGKLFEWAQESEGHWQVCSLVFHPNSGSQTITIVPDDASRCDRE